MDDFLDNINWALLAPQKRLLLEITDIIDDGVATDLLDGLVNLIDSLQDLAEKRGLPVVWLSENDGTLEAPTTEGQHQ